LPFAPNLTNKVFERGPGKAGPPPVAIAPVFRAELAEFVLNDAFEFAHSSVEDDDRVVVAIAASRSKPFRKEVAMFD
jgi:hypothetical protein